jgi:hypothetical protein
VPASAQTDGNPDDLAELDGWLRGHRFNPADIPWPVRIIVGDDCRSAAVQVRAGLAIAGNPPPRAWRSFALTLGFPGNIVPSLGIDQVFGPSAAQVAALIDVVPGARDLPAPEGVR